LLLLKKEEHLTLSLFFNSIQKTFVLE